MHLQPPDALLETARFAAYSYSTLALVYNLHPNPLELSAASIQSEIPASALSTESTVRRVLQSRSLHSALRQDVMGPSILRVLPNAALGACAS